MLTSEADEIGESLTSFAVACCSEAILFANVRLTHVKTHNYFIAMCCAKSKENFRADHR